MHIQSLLDTRCSEKMYVQLFVYSSNFFRTTRLENILFKKIFLVDLYLNLLVNTLNVNEVNTPVKTQRLLECIQQNKIHVYAPYMIQSLNVKHR